LFDISKKAKIFAWLPEDGIKGFKTIV